MRPVAAEVTSLVSQHTVASTGSRSIYSRGPGFSLETFASRDFIARDFIESLAEGVVQSSRRSGPYSLAFDPKPYIRTFEHALSRLDQLLEEREVHENELASAVRRAEAQHKQHCATLQRKLDQALESFRGLEHGLEAPFHELSGIYNGSTTNGNLALQVGEKLETLDRQKHTADDARFLLHCWQDVNERQNLTHLEDLRRLGGGDGKVKSARVARQLLKISQRLKSLSIPASDASPNGSADGQVDNRVPSDERTRQYDEVDHTIEKFLEGLEKDLLERFDECKRQHNDIGMKDCAIALFDFGGGASVTARFVNTHEFFLERTHLVTAELSKDPEFWNVLADPDAEPSGVELSFQSLVDEVKLVLQEESFIIKQVFPFHEQVLLKFLQRICQQSIQQRLEIVLEKAEATSALAYLRSLQATRNYVGAMVEELKSHGLTEHPEAGSGQVSASLDQQLEDLFVPYNTGSSYVDRERRNLEELYTSLLFRFTLFHSKRRKLPTSYIGVLGQRGKELLSAARDTFIERLDSSDLTTSQKSTLLRIAGVRDVDAKNRSEIDLTEEDGKLSIRTAKRMLCWLAESIGRGLELNGVNDNAKDMAAMQRLLLTNLGEIYLDTSLDATSDAAAAQEHSKNEPDLAFLNDLHAAINVLQLLLNVSKTILIPLASSNVTIRRDMEKAISNSVSRMEEKISMIRARTIEVALTWVQKLLSRQSKADYRPRDDEIAIEQLQTLTCSAIFTFLERARDISLRAMDGRNAEPFFTDLAVGLRTLLFDHFRRFQVNLAGGLMVSKDITKYIELLRSFPLASGFLPSLEVLVEIGNIFVIGPEALKDRLRGGSALTGIDKADLRPYIQRREDSNSVGIISVLNAL